MDTSRANVTPAVRLPQQFLCFAAVGLLGTGAHYLALALLLRAGWHPTLATAGGAVLGALVNYRLNYRYTFKSAEAHRRTAPRFAEITVVGWLLNAALFHGLHPIAGWALWPAQILTTLLVLLWNFAGNRWWTFASERHD